MSPSPKDRIPRAVSMSVAGEADKLWVTADPITPALPAVYEVGHHEVSLILPGVKIPYDAHGSDEVLHMCRAAHQLLAIAVFSSAACSPFASFCASSLAQK